MQKRGIDISYHQGEIDFNKLKGKIDFVMVRSSYGLFHIDEKFKRNVSELIRLGIPYGIYHFSYAKNKIDAKKEALNLVELIKFYNPTYPVVIDIESSETTRNITSKELINIANAFCETLEKNNYYAMIYANLDYLNNKLNSNILDKYDKWLAQWSNKPTYNKKFGIWQYTSKGQIEGIKGNVDMDIAYKDYPLIIKEKKLNEPIIENNKEINYAIKKGDTLIKIAKKYNIDYKKIALDNNIKDPNKIIAGDVIKIYLENEIIPQKYIVKKGDTLIKIAKKYNKNWKDVYNNNKEIIGNNPNMLKQGIILKIY